MLHINFKPLNCLLYQKESDPQFNILVPLKSEVRPNHNTNSEAKNHQSMNSTRLSNTPSSIISSALEPNILDPITTLLKLRTTLNQLHSASPASPSIKTATRPQPSTPPGWAKLPACPTWSRPNPNYIQARKTNLRTSFSFTTWTFHTAMGYLMLA